MTAAALARSADVTPEWISKVERDHETPSYELVNRLAKALDFPSDFFYREPARLPSTEAFHFRASSKLALKDEAAAQSLASLASELSERRIERTNSRSPDPRDQDLVGAKITADPGTAAEALRNYWGSERRRSTI